MINPSMCCHEELIYLGANYDPNVLIMFEGPNYIYACSKCGRLEWSSDKRRTAIKWYNAEKKLGITKEEFKELVLGRNNLKICQTKKKI